jgi:hypothetical protein
MAAGRPISGGATPEDAVGWAAWPVSLAAASPRPDAAGPRRLPVRAASTGPGRTCRGGQTLRPAAREPVI